MVRSTYPDVEIPDASTHEFLFGGLNEAELETVGVGTTVGVLCPNISAFANVFHGILRAGATTTINSL